MTLSDAAEDAELWTELVAAMRHLWLKALLGDKAELETNIRVKGHERVTGSAI